MKYLPKFWSEIVLVVSLFAIDSISKAMFINANKVFISGVFNTAWAWWIPFPMRILIVVSIVAIVFCFIAYNKKLIPYWSFVLLLSWALWNLFDRIVFWWVRDWLNIQIIPVFNIADVFITLWVCVFIYHERYKKPWNH